MNTFVSVLLVVTIITGEGKQNAQHYESMPDMATCFRQAQEFMNHEFSDAIDAKGLVAACQGKLTEKNPS